MSGRAATTGARPGDASECSATRGPPRAARGAEGGPWRRRCRGCHPCSAGCRRRASPDRPSSLLKKGHLLRCDSVARAHGGRSLRPRRGVMRLHGTQWSTTRGCIRDRAGWRRHFDPAHRRPIATWSACSRRSARVSCVSCGGGVANGSTRANVRRWTICRPVRWNRPLKTSRANETGETCDGARRGTDPASRSQPAARMTDEPPKSVQLATMSATLATRCRHRCTP